ncbi:hypothetical protein GSI_01431 [Ganoderma sinense ZZ0214-1]|uniref:Arrestin-like N-terminal domain-containing protein n=1 Tax=Ganoderma sinense ZZ0214-1 TaxID=1077348 RepID=A0A2G8SVE0_9APHY|nr:hypothetical protein GSI_01431 [Ganoderma sinense ZZ0214-1]
MASNPAASILSQARIAGPFSLVIPPTTYCPGSDVEGEVLLTFPKVQEEKIDEVVVALLGNLKASVVVSHGNQRRSISERQELVSLRTSLWKRGSAYPPPGSHVLRLPFRFRLPSDPKLLPSIPSNAGSESASIKYYVEVIAHRPTVLFGAEDKTMRRQLTVVSRGDPGLCASIRSLRGLSAEGGPTWKTVHKEKKMRRGIWGEYSTARVERAQQSNDISPGPLAQLLIPNQHGILPTCIDIPLLVTVKTTTARLSRAKAHKHPEGQGKPVRVFPAIDFDTNDRRFVSLQQAFTVRVRGHTRQHTNEIALAYIKPEDILPSESAYYKHWQADTAAGDRPGEEMGRWVQQWTLQRSVKLQRFPPTFECDFVDCAYVMSVRVPFPGLGNDIEVSTRISLDSGIDHAMPQKNGRATRRVPSATTLTEASGPSASGLGTDVPVPLAEEPQSANPPVRPPTYFDAVYRDGRVVGEGD